MCFVDHQWPDLKRKWTILCSFPSCVSKFVELYRGAETILEMLEKSNCNAASQYMHSYKWKKYACLLSAQLSVTLNWHTNGTLLLASEVMKQLSWSLTFKCKLEKPELVFNLSHCNFLMKGATCVCILNYNWMLEFCMII